jgi:sister chromatid cohesion protein DCC1
MDVTFASFQPSTTYSLLELPTELLELLSRDAAPFEIKGRPADETVLCSQAKTYAVRAIKSSNALLLCLPRDGSLACVSTLHRAVWPSARRVWLIR